MRTTFGHFEPCACQSRRCHWRQRDVCESQHHPGPHLPADREFGDTAATDLFVLADSARNQLSSMNIFDLASIFGVVAMVPSQHSKVAWDHFFKHWITYFGVPRSLIQDQGGDFEREFGQETWVVNSCRQPPSLHSKTQPVNGMVESGKHTQDGSSTSSASGLSPNRCTA